MRRPVVYIGSPPQEAIALGWTTGALVALPKEKLHHLTRVLRRTDGDEVAVTDGQGATADGVLDGGSVRLTADATLTPAGAPPITVVHALPKGRAMDEVVRTLAELGVARVQPVLSDRTESRPTGAKAQAVGERLRSVAASALEQAQGAHLCAIDDPRSLSVTERERGQSADTALKLLAHPAAGLQLAAAFQTAGTVTAVSLAVGPEGGFTDSEVGTLSEAGWIPVRAGDTVLRTVHAGTVLVAGILALTGGFGPIHGSNG